MGISINKTVWDLSPLLASDNDPKQDQYLADAAQAIEAFAAKWTTDTSYLQDPHSLKEALDEYETLSRVHDLCGPVDYYFSLRSSQDENSPAIKAAEAKVHDHSIAMMDKIRFFEHSLAMQPLETLTSLSKDPILRDYQHFIERLAAAAPYLLSEPEEKILAAKSQTSHSKWVELTSGLLAKQEREILQENGTRSTTNISEILSLLQSNDKQVRDTAAAAFQDVLNATLDVAEAEINAILADKKTNDDLRGRTRPDLARHISDDISSETVDTLLTSVEQEFSISQDYYRLKAKLLGQETLAYHERNILYGQLNEEYSFPDAAELVHTTFQKLDPEFGSIFAGFAEQGLLDVFPRKNKRSGAFCAHHLISQPTYILLNHTGTLPDVLTIAHEAGHGINNELIKQKQHALYFGTPMATAEVASTFMEDFVLQELLSQASPEERLSIIMMKLNEDISSIFRQVACYRFEQELHQEFRKQGYLSKETIGAIFQKHMSAYMGPAIDQTPGSEHWWIYWSHIRTFFYVYSYASGMLISKSLQRSVKEDPAFIEQVKEFLSAGLSLSPETIFSNLGITISSPVFWKQGLQEIRDLLGEAESLARELGKI